MSFDIDDFIEEFDDLADNVSHSAYDFFCPNLRRWLSLMESEPAVASVIAELEKSADFDEWKETGLERSIGMGHGRVRLPEKKDERLSIQIQLFRMLAESETDALDFARSYVSSGGDHYETITDLTSKLFDPFVRDLRRELHRSFARKEEQAPASDRIVPLDHNNPHYAELLVELKGIEKSLQGVNEIHDTDEVELRIAELSAGQKLLEASKVRLDALYALLGKCLKYLAAQFRDNLVGRLASNAIEKLVEYLPAILKFFLS